MSTPKAIKLVLILAVLGILYPIHSTSQVYLNELMASNATMHADIDFGNYCDWIELYNSTDQEIDLSGYYLSDDSTNLNMWQFQSGTTIPAAGFILVYADGTGFGLHSNFKLAKEGEQLLLVNPELVILDSIRYPSQLSDISFGRSGADFQTLGYFDQPSPGEMNSDQVKAGISSPPVFSLESGFYTGPQTIEITTENPGEMVYYTLDGTDPTESSETYAAPIEISQTTVLRVKTIGDKLLPGLTITQSYIIDEPQNLPVISLVTDPDHLFSDETGIYVEGTAGRPGYCTSVPHNVNQDWERPVNIELIEKDGSRGLNQLAGVKIFGGCSRVRYPMKSLAFFARKEYENASFKYRLFPDKSNDQYETFILRASADDQPFTLFRDPLTQMLVKDVIDVDVQAYRPVVVYINGEYWGIHNMREKINEHYAEDNYGVNSDSVDVLRRNPEKSWNVVAGNADHYNAMMNYLMEHDITQDVSYEYMNSQMDMDEYINYQIIQIFFGGRDWPGNNIKFWRSREAPFNKWRWVLYDLDHMFKEYFSDIMDEATEEDCGCTWPNAPWSTYLFRRLLENEDFKHKFTQRFAIYSSTHFSRERLHKFINEMQAELAPEIPRHIERWGGQQTNLPDNTWVAPILESVSQWEANVQVMRDFTDRRHEMAMKHVNDYFGETGFVHLDTHLKPHGTGSIKIGENLLQDSAFSALFTHGETLKVESVVEPGYLFSHWLVQHLSPNDTSLIPKGDQWKYLVSRDTPDENWTAAEYNDEHWESGRAQLGYGDDDEETVVGYGGDPGNKNISTWFRKQFVIEDTSLYRTYTVNLLRDDGARVFVNGHEMIRDNMQRWSVGAQATAEEDVNGLNESTWYSFSLNPAKFRNGENVIAVDIHQSDSARSDISFDLQLLAHSNRMGALDTIYDNKLVLELLNDHELSGIIIADTMIVEQVFINEVMASNEGDLMDEVGEYEDWIEFYNAGEVAVNLGGLYLSDTFPVRDPWVFPVNQPELTTLMPDSFLVVFADKDLEQGPLHAGFKISKDGEEVVLLQKIGPDTIIIDQIAFGNQSESISYGRYPDGSPVFEYMNITTPWASNRLSNVSIHSNWEVLEEVSVYPVPSSGPLFVKFKEAPTGGDLPVKISVYSMTGSLVSSTHHNSSQLITLSLESQPAGLYMIKITAGEHLYVKRVVLN